MRLVRTFIKRQLVRTAAFVLTKIAQRLDFEINDRGYPVQEVTVLVFLMGDGNVGYNLKGG